MTGWMLLWGYIAGYLPAARLCATVVAQHAELKPRCHGESKTTGDGHEWSARSYCVQYCKPGCWRVDEAPDRLRAGQALLASTLALVWPLLITPLVVLKTYRPPKPPATLQQRIDRLERELEMGEHQ